LNQKDVPLTFFNPPFLLGLGAYLELAQKLGVNEMTIVNWEVKGRVPAKRHMEKIRQTVEWV